jgi:hypothetical protein
VALAPNTLEVRVADSVFDVLVNGAVAHTFVDGRFCGYGQGALEARATALPCPTAHHAGNAEEGSGPLENGL